MIISTNKEPSLEEFEEICNKACQLMNEIASREPEYYLTKGGQKLEKEIMVLKLNLRKKISGH